MTQSQWRKAEYLAKRIWNGPRYMVEAAWGKLVGERTTIDRYSLSYPAPAPCGWSNLIAARA